MTTHIVAPGHYFWQTALPDAALYQPLSGQWVLGYDGTNWVIADPTTVANVLNVAQYVKLGSDAFTTSNVFGSVAGLQVAVAANKDYLIEGFLAYTTAATTTGIALGFTGPANPTAIIGYTEAFPAANTIGGKNFAAYDVLSPYAGSVAGLNVAKATVLFRNGNNAGNFTLRLASGVNGSEVRVKNGSALRSTLV